jgi:early secretory antigenic target protein ESAT-6
MSMDGIRVNHAGLEAAAQDLKTGVNDIDNRLNQLEQDLAPLRSDWSGQAQASYTQAKAKWDTAIQEMKDLLDQTSQTVTRSNQDYQAADKRGALAFE